MTVAWRADGYVLEDDDRLTFVRHKDLPKLAAMDPELAARCALLDLQYLAAYEWQWGLEGPHA